MAADSVISGSEVSTRAVLHTRDLMKLDALMQHYYDFVRTSTVFECANDTTFLTVTVDFKPVSLGSSKDMMLEVGGENSNQNQVNATIPGKHVN